MKLIIGLGNPGKKYENTRHNAGFMVVDWFVSYNELPEFKLDKKLEAAITRTDGVLIAKPQTFMNESGRSVIKIADYYKIKPEDIWVIYDDKDLPFGSLRIRQSGSAGGHNGVKSIIEHLGTENFPHFRFGIVEPDIKIKDTAKYVLKPFSRKNRVALEDHIRYASNALHSALRDGLDMAMNKNNS
ncbi:aminoacyl-tRNA hydrolase [Patescibacteria group bacterium]|nr:aminoacyl-tRNA hydrolase [Patescibacteria group bacterium]MBU1672972.1 aminoacyl-tRNA hydrolase [Patescibacteria group bacterium]MBU1962993.1 aminoacyl-tRNA hydrolase [Patescibacteria group bacterium]